MLKLRIEVATVRWREGSFFECYLVEKAAGVEEAVMEGRRQHLGRRVKTMQPKSDLKSLPPTTAGRIGWEGGERKRKSCGRKARK